MKIWVSGAKGLVGSALCRRKELPIIATGKELDIADKKQVEAFLDENQDIDQIINCAAFSLVDQSETFREEAFRANALGPEVLAQAAKKRNVHFLHISTDYVFRGDVNRPLTEEDAANPCNYYGETKLEGERRVFLTNPQACVLRTSWVFGRGGKNFVASLLSNLQSVEEIRLINDQWGRPTYVEDLVQVILEMRGKTGLYQFANQGIATKFLFGCEMRDGLEKLGIFTKPKLVSVPGHLFMSPCKRPKYSAFDTTKIEKELNIKIRSWKEALREFLCNQFAS